MTVLKKPQKISSSEIDDTLQIKTQGKVVIDGDLSIEDIRACNDANLRINGSLDVKSYVILENVNNVHINGSLCSSGYIRLFDSDITVMEDIRSEGSYIKINNCSVINKEGSLETKQSYIHINNIAQNKKVELGDINSQTYVQIKNSNGVNCRYIDSIHYVNIEGSKNINCTSINSGQSVNIKSKSLVNVQGTVNPDTSVRSSNQSILNANSVNSDNIIINDTSEINAPSVENSNKTDGNNKSKKGMKDKILSKIKQVEEKQGSGIDKIDRDTLLQCIILKFRNVPMNDADFSNIVQGYEDIETILREIETYHDVKKISQSNDNSIQFTAKELERIKKAYHSDDNEEVDDGFNDMLNNNSLADLMDDVDTEQENQDSEEQDEDIYEDFI